MKHLSILKNPAPLLLLLIGIFFLASGFYIDDPIGKRQDRIKGVQMSVCGGCNPVVAAVKNPDVRRVLRNAYTPGFTITPVIEFQVGCFDGGCFTRIQLVKTAKCDFPPCSPAPDQLVAVVEIGCDCMVEQLKSVA